jgi:hypothetical protein
MIVGLFSVGGAAIVVFMSVDTGDFSGIIVDVSAAKEFGFPGTTAVRMLMAVVAAGFPLVIVFVARFVWRRCGHAPHDMAMTIRDGSILTIIMDVVASFFRFFTRVFTMLFTHVSLPPVLFTINLCGLA